MDTPRKTKLYNQLAKDYTPKHAAMLMCRHMEETEKQLVARIEALEKAVEAQTAADAEERKSGRKQKSATVAVIPAAGIVEDAVQEQKFE